MRQMWFLREVHALPGGTQTANTCDTSVHIRNLNYYVRRERAMPKILTAGPRRQPPWL